MGHCDRQKSERDIKILEGQRSTAVQHCVNMSAAYASAKLHVT